MSQSRFRTVTAAQAIVMANSNSISGIHAASSTGDAGFVDWNAVTPHTYPLRRFSVAPEAVEEKPTFTRKVFNTIGKVIKTIIIRPSTSSSAFFLRRLSITRESTTATTNTMMSLAPSERMDDAAEHNLDKTMEWAEGRMDDQARLTITRMQLHMAKLDG